MKFLRARNILMSASSVVVRIDDKVARARALIIGSLIATLSFASPVISKPLEKETVIHYASTGISFSSAPFMVAAAKGFFDAEKLKVLYVASGQSAQVSQQILARAVEMGECSLNDVIQIVQMSNAPLILVSNQTVSALNYGILSKPTIKTWADLKNKTIIVGGPKDNTVFFTRSMARPNGLKDGDYQFQFAGASGARFAALKSGAVDAAILTDPFDSEAELQGYLRIDDLRPKYLGSDSYAGGGMITTKEWAKAHPDEIVAMIRALDKTKNWIYDPANKDELFEILKPKLNVTREAFDRTYARNVVADKMWSMGAGVAIESAVKGVVDSLIDLGALPNPAPPATKFFDNTWAELAEKSGP